MMTNLEQVLQAALSLTEEDRGKLVDSLIGTLEPENAGPLDEAWLVEIQRRSAEYDAGLIKAIPWQEVKVRARQRLNHG